MSVPFWKMTGAGNDFIAIDNRRDILPADADQRAAFIARICRRRLDIGADGVLLIESPRDTGTHFCMRYYNADGGEAETCGNGARCIARFAHELGIAPESMRFDTSAGPYTALVKPDSVTVSMSDAFGLKQDISLGIDCLPGVSADFVNTGVPHTVIICEELETLDIVGTGRAIRYHQAFAPEGTNANFVAPGEGPDHFLIRTYERGVEDETLACGTGCIASAIVLQRRGRAASPVTLKVRSGAELKVHFTAADGGATDVQIQGEARVVCRGEIQ
jgi:diaminopimelate epimerase